MVDFSGSSGANISLDSHMPVELLPVFVGWVIQILQELCRNFIPNFENSLSQLLFCGWRVPVQPVFHPQPNVFNQVQVRTL